MEIKAILGIVAAGVSVATATIKLIKEIAK